MRSSGSGTRDPGGRAPPVDLPQRQAGQGRQVTRRPEWLRVHLPGGAQYAEVKRLLRRLRLHTVCGEAACPNVAECWGRGAMTLMILGDVCTRACRFCNVGSRSPGAPDPEEPQHVARALAELDLRHAVITSVTRDDLPDGGAAHWAATLRAVRDACPRLTVEALVPDFGGDLAAVDEVLDAAPHVFAHNLETVRRLTPEVRSHASYNRSLKVLAHAASRGAVVKSGLMAGLGETDDELLEALADLRQVGVVLVTVGQYLQPSRSHLPVARYVHPDTFDALARRARELGFLHVAAGPLVRSSYQAEVGAAAAGVTADSPRRPPARHT